MNEARNSEIIGLWNEGLTAAAIATRFGISRNAVIGIAHRARVRGQITRVPSTIGRTLPMPPPPRKPKMPLFKILPPYPQELWLKAATLWRVHHCDTAEISRRLNIPEPVLYSSLAAAADRRGERSAA